MQLTELAKLKVAVLGFGHEGQAVFSYLKKHGIYATVLDEKTDGEDYLEKLKDFEIAFRSPGIPRLSPKILEAEQAGVIITSQTKWFFEHCLAPIIGVTGTKGKGTTCSLIYETLKAGGKSAYLTGNIGKTAPLEILDDLANNDLVVFELSSFQLQDLQQSPNIGVCLMVTADHLNHHKDLTEYHLAKTAITGFQTATDVAIFNVDYPATVEIGNLGKGEKLTISAKAKPSNGAYIEGEKIFIIDEQAQFEQTFDFSTRKLRGAHNLENIAANILVCLQVGIAQEIIAQTSQEFAGLEHRLQFVGTFNGISYYDDSISTVPETAIAAIHSFTEPIHLILGGSNKGHNYEQLVEEIVNQDNIASVTLLGDDGQILKALFDIKKRDSDWNVPVSEVYTDFDQAITDIKARAKAGDVGVLSPATASFDMFKNYAERGQQFVKLISKN